MSIERTATIIGGLSTIIGGRSSNIGSRSSNIGGRLSNIGSSSNIGFLRTAIGVVNSTW